jgi:2-keto-3-deoxy-L-rhamnonate aldolase RhmA
MYDAKNQGNAPAALNRRSGERPTPSFIATIQSSPSPILGIVLSIPSVWTAQAAALSGAQWAFIDMEHAPLSPETATQMAHAVVSASQGACYPVIRVPSHGVEWIKWALDSGAAGILVPMVNSAAEMAQIIDRAAYPPLGRRSFGPALAPFGDPDGPRAGGLLGYYARAREGAVAILPMIESREGLENVEEIVAMEGVAGVFIGPYDLRLGLGLAGGQDGDEADFVQAMARIVAAAKRCKKVVGTMALGQEVVKKRTAEGFDFLGSAMDMGVLTEGCVRTLEDARKASSKL